MRWAWRFVRARSALLALTTALSVVSATPAAALEPPLSWLIVRTSAPAHAGLLAPGQAEIVAAMQSDGPRLVFVYGHTRAVGADRDRRRLTGLLTREVGAPGAEVLWQLAERSDLSYMPSNPFAGPIRHRIAFLEVPQDRLPRAEARLRARRDRMAREGDPRHLVVLQDPSADEVARLALIEPLTGRPPDRRLARLAQQIDVVTGRLLLERSPREVGAEAGLMAHLVTREAMASPLEPLPGPPAEDAAADRAVPTEPLDAIEAVSGNDDATAAPASASAGEATANAPAAIPAAGERPPADRPPPSMVRAAAAPQPVPPLPADVLDPVDPVGPADDPVAPLPPTEAQQQSIRQAARVTVEGWADAWARQHVPAYLDAYAATFQPPDRSLATWRDDRRDRIATPNHIEIELGPITFEVVDHDHVRVVFEQTYRSDRYTDRVRKRLDLIRQGSHFKIVREHVLQRLDDP